MRIFNYCSASLCSENTAKCYHISNMRFRKSRKNIDKRIQTFLIKDIIHIYGYKDMWFVLLAVQEVVFVVCIVQQYFLLHASRRVISNAI